MDYKTVNDYEVVYMIRESDDDSREILFKKYLPLIGKIAYKYLDKAKQVGIEYDDLIQEGWIALDKALQNFDYSGNVLFFTYAYICIERHIITYCRRNANYKNYPLNNSESDDIIYSIKDNNYEPSLEFERYNLEKEVNKFLNSLDIEYSSVFELRYNGFSYKEISELLDLPISTIDGRIYRIRKDLHKILKMGD